MARRGVLSDATVRPPTPSLDDATVSELNDILNNIPSIDDL